MDECYKELALGGFNEQLNADLARIGWQIENDRPSPAKQRVRELFFPPNTQHDSYVEIRKIARDARHSVRIVDPYLYETLFNLFSHVDESLKIELLTNKLPRDFMHEIKNFRKQYPQIAIKVRRADDFHDRFIIIDDKKCWHIGCSIKDAGNRAFLPSRIEDPKNIRSLSDADRISCRCTAAGVRGRFIGRIRSRGVSATPPGSRSGCRGTRSRPPGPPRPRR